MPSYGYECTRCEHTFELVQKITDPPRKRCPRCRGKVYRVISGGGGIILKGSGFYVTDYRSEEYKKAAKAERESAPSPSKSTSKPKKTSTTAA